MKRRLALVLSIAGAAMGAGLVWLSRRARRRVRPVQPDDQGREPQSTSWRKAALTVAGVVAGLYLLTAAVYYAAAEPAACGICHALRPYVVSWRLSPHRQVKCLCCHEKQGFAGKLDSILRGANDVYQTATGQWTYPVSGRLFEQNCLACHLGDYRGHRSVVRLDKRHENYVRADKPCVLCHRDTGHKVNLFPSSKYRQGRTG